MLERSDTETLGTSNFSVITSYSIHYTKLYEDLFSEIAGIEATHLRLGLKVLLMAAALPAGFYLVERLFLKRFRRGTRITSYNVCYTKLLRLMNWSIVIAGSVMIWMVPLDPSATEIFAIVSLLGASTTFTKS